MDIEAIKKLVKDEKFVNIAKHYRTGYYARSDQQQAINDMVMAGVKEQLSQLGLSLSDSLIEELISKTSDIELEDQRSKMLLEKGMRSNSSVDYVGDFERSMARRTDMQADLQAIIEGLDNTKMR